ncbi:MAG TPA: YggT family protein [Nitratifractor sp.]|jgi:YggT family protein|nr:YggT family protein [Nitratifractor sp.]HHD74359.1 YggT family protein [Nitratifractor sp.]
MSIVVNSFLSLVILLLNIYIWVVIIAAIISFVNPDPYNPVVQFIRKATEPVFSFLRQKFPFLIVSGVDLSPLVLIFGINILIGILSRFYL